MSKRIFDPLKKAGMSLSVTSFATAQKLLTDNKVKAAKLGVTMTSLLTASVIKGQSQVKTKQDVIHIICGEFGLDEALITKLAEEHKQGGSLKKDSDSDGGES